MGRRRLFYGWYVVGVAALAMVGTLPGRTQGLGLITEPLLADLEIDRVTYAAINLWTTIAGAFGAIGIGRLTDRFGSRTVLTAIALLLGLVVCLMSRVRTTGELAVALVLTRAIGQSALSVVSIAMVGHWFVKRINMAMAIYSLALSIGFMAAFPLVGALIQGWGWRGAWNAIGIALLAGLAPVAWFVDRSKPESIGEQPDGIGVVSSDPTAPAPAAGPLSGYQLSEAARTGAFWVFGIGAALYGLVASGIGLFNESILAERGFGPDVYYQTLVVTAMTALAGNFLGGFLADRMSTTRLMALALLTLAAGLAVLPFVASFTAVMAWATMMGVGGGVVMVLFFSVWPIVFGRRHLGRIQGAAQALTVLASAAGPLVVAWYADTRGSYAGVFLVLAGLVTLTAAASWLVKIPGPACAAATDRT